MTISTATKLRNRALMLLRIERSQFYEQVGLLGYGEEKAAPMKKRGKSAKRLQISSLIDTIPPISTSVH